MKNLFQYKASAFLCPYTQPMQLRGTKLFISFNLSCGVWSTRRPLKIPGRSFKLQMQQTPVDFVWAWDSFTDIIGIPQPRHRPRRMPLPSPRKMPVLLHTRSASNWNRSQYEAVLAVFIDIAFAEDIIGKNGTPQPRHRPRRIHSLLRGRCPLLPPELLMRSASNWK